MAEPYAAMALEDEQQQKQKALNPAAIDLPAYKPAWEVGDHIDQGTEDLEDSDAAKAARQRTTIQAVSEIPDSTQRSFTSGGNFAYQIYKQVDRAIKSGPIDPDWNNRKADWLKANHDAIPESQQWRYMQTRNEDEASALLSDANTQAADQAVLASRGGVSTFVAQGLAGIMDVDTIPSLMLGGLTLEAKTGIVATRAAQLGVSGLIGAGTATASATGGYLADPNADWTVIPTVGLAGFAFGAAGGLLSGGARTEANAARQATLNEFGETLHDGIPRAKENIHAESFEAGDPYGHEMAQAATADLEEAISKEKATVAPAKEERAPASFDVDETSQTNVVDPEIPTAGTTLYHGTMSDFDTFDTKFAGANSAEFNSSKGFFFSNDPEVAATYAQKKGLFGTKTGTVKEVQADINNPVVIDMQGKDYSDAVSQMDLAIAQLDRKVPGYEDKDGIIFKNLADAKDRGGKVSDVYFIPDTSKLRIKQPTEIPQEGRSSIGARQLGTTGPGPAAIRNQQLLSIVQNAKTRVQQLGLATDWVDGWGHLGGTRGAVGRQVERFHNAMMASPLASDFARMMNSGSSVAQTVAYDLLENAAGIIRNSRSAARLMEHYQRMLASPFTAFEDHYAEYAGARGASWIQRNWDTNLRDQFNRDVATEMQARFFDGPAAQVQRQVDAAVAKAADALDATFKREVDVMKGRPGEMSVAGSDQLQAKSGYMPQKWSGRQMQRLINAGRSRDDIVEAIAEAYQRVHTNMTPADAATYADAVVGRAEKFELGINTNLIGMLRADGRVELEDILRRNNMPQAEIDAFIDRLTGAAETAGAPGHTKARLDIDTRMTAGNGVNIMDLVDTDFATMIPRRIRRTAGQSALARKGIASQTTWNNIVDAILEEQRTNGPNVATGTSLKDRAMDFIDKDKPIDRDYLNGLYSYFSGGPIGGGISPAYSRIMKLTNLSLLNQLGLTSLAELGPTIASVGVGHFVDHLTDAIKAEFKNAGSQLIQDLQHFDVFVPEERMFRDDRMHEMEAPASTYELMRNADRLLNKASRIQGYTSGFYAIRNIQQRLAMTSGTEKLMQHFRNGNVITPDRLHDLALGDINDLNRMAQYVHNGTVQFDNQGRLVSLNLSQWKPEDVELFSTTMNAHVNQLVQRAMAGESNYLFRKDGVTSLFTHLKAFPMLAIEKQVLRNSRMMDTEAAMSFMYGLATAGAVYMARQTINGRTDRLKASDIARGAFGYSNFTGWIPMWVDPLAGMLGMDNLRLGGYTPLYGQNQVLSTPAALPTLDRLLQIPGSLASTVANLGPTHSDINALTAAPIIGNAYGFALMFNALR
jgi:hypothetical protein